VTTVPTPQPLRGRRVVDLSQFIAGSACGQLLADFGAEVTKVEPRAGDPARALGDTGSGSAYFRQYNTGKQSRLLDLTDPVERAELDEMLAAAEILVVNFSPRTLAKHGLDWPTLHARFPMLVVVVISAYGDGDERTAFDSIAQAVSGYAHVNADEAGAPRVTAGYPTDVLSGLYGGLSAAMVVLDPERVSGVLVDVAMVEVAMSALCGPALLTAVETGAAPRGVGNRDIATAPSTTFRCQDGYAYVYAGLDKHWARLGTLVGGDDAPLERRLADPGRFEAAVSAWTRDQTVAAVCARMDELGIPAGPILEPQVALREIQERRPRAVVDASCAGGPVPQFPVTFSGARVVRDPAPALPTHPRLTEEP